MQETALKTKKPIVVFPFLAMGLTALLTVFAYPTREPGIVMDSGSFRELARVSIVTLSPAFGRDDNKKLYSVVLSPSLRKYANTAPSRRHPILARPHTYIHPDGTITAEQSSFAWDYWFLIVAFPCAAIGYIEIRIVAGRREHAASPPT